jgi:DNA adenine methylase
MTTRINRPALRWLGGKYRLAPQIIAMMPPHRIYAEAFAGGYSVGLRKPRSYNEVLNDLNGEIVNLFQVLRCPASSAKLRDALHLTPYARAEYLAAIAPTDCAIERARRLVVRSHMAHGTGGARIDRPTGFRNDGTSGTTNVAGEWADLPTALLAITERLRGVTIEQMPAVDLLRRMDAPNVLHYLDPPYMPETRSMKSRKAEGYHTYRHEMTIDDHAELLEVCAASTAMIMLSGYATSLYDSTLSGWHRVEFSARAHRNSPRTEVLWLNPPAAEAINAPQLKFGACAA